VEQTVRQHTETLLHVGELIYSLQEEDQKNATTFGSLKGGLEAVTERVVEIASGLEAVTGCVVEMESRLAVARQDYMTARAAAEELRRRQDDFQASLRHEVLEEVGKLRTSLQLEALTLSACVNCRSHASEPFDHRSANAEPVDCKSKELPLIESEAISSQPRLRLEDVHVQLKELRQVLEGISQVQEQHVQSPGMPGEMMQPRSDGQTAEPFGVPIEEAGGIAEPPLDGIAAARSLHSRLHEATITEPPLLVQQKAEIGVAAAKDLTALVMPPGTNPLSRPRSPAMDRRPPSSQNLHGCGVPVLPPGSPTGQRRAQSPVVWHRSTLPVASSGSRHASPKPSEKARATICCSVPPNSSPPPTVAAPLRPQDALFARRPNPSVFMYPPGHRVTACVQASAAAERRNH